MKQPETFKNDTLEARGVKFHIYFATWSEFQMVCYFVFSDSGLVTGDKGQKSRLDRGPVTGDIRINYEGTVLPLVS
jgi:hypothetical protein